MMVPVGRLTIVRTFAKSELIRAMAAVAIPGLIGPMLGPVAGGFIVGYFHWRVIFFVNIPIGLIGLWMVHLHLPDYKEKWNPLDIVGLILFGSGIALLSYVLEVFGEHTLATGEILGLLATSVALLAGYWIHSTKARFPLLNPGLFRIRTFRASVSGSYFTRLGIGGIPFMMPLLYQVGLGFTPIQSGLLMMPQAIAAMSLKMTMPKILALFGYRAVLISNTIILGLLILSFATIGIGTPVWIMVLLGFAFGFFSSLQYTSMNTLVFADIDEEQASSASTIASTMQQMAISFGIAVASLAAAFFVPDRFHSTSDELIQGIHKAFFVLGALTVVSTLIFRELKASDGANASQHKTLQHAE
jgi:MFS family permease